MSGILEQSKSFSSDLKPEGTSERRNRRRRLQLSCGECRKKKLSCDRNFPCQRCIRSGRPEQCTFETITGQPPVVANQVLLQQDRQNSDEVRNLRAEVARLRRLLASQSLQKNENDSVGDTLHAPNYASLPLIAVAADNHEDGPEIVDVASTNHGLSDPRKRSPAYYSQHTLLRFFYEIPQLFPFIKETSDEWLKPLGIHLQKKPTKNKLSTDVLSQNSIALEDLLPAKDDADSLVSIYLGNFEHLHRIVHVPTFKREYANFWIPGRPRYPAMTVLVLLMISISACASVHTNDSLSSTFQGMPLQRISVCDTWLRQQSSKHNKLVHYQLGCLIYLAKRMNIIKKKMYWKETSSLIQDAVMDGLHRDPSLAVNSPFMVEMKRRLWATLQELDLQTSLEFRLPTLLHNIDSDVRPPTNIDDEDFDETSEALPTSKAPCQYTSTSYQIQSSRSWVLRLEVSRRLFSSSSSQPLGYDDVLRYTHELTQAMHSLPTWGTDSAESSKDIPKQAQLAATYVKFQLMECILALNRPYLQKASSKFWLSENVCYQMARDILLLNTKLASMGLQNLTMLRDDLLFASLSLVRINMLQPKDSTSIIMANAISTMDLLEQCLPFMEDRQTHCPHEPWCFLTMFAAVMQLKIYLRKESWQTAKSACAQKFLALHYSHVCRQQTPIQRDQLLSSSNAMEFSDSGWLNSRYPDIGIDPFDLNMDLDSIWNTWEGAEWSGLQSASLDA